MFSKKTYDVKNKSIINQGFVSIVIKVIGLGFGFITNIMLARVLGVEEYSIYVYVIAILSVLAVPAMLGLPTLVIRETAKNVNKDWGLVRGLWAWSNRVVVLMSLVLVLTIGIYFYVNEFFYSEVEVKTILWGLFFIPLSAFAAIRAASLRGIGEVIKGQLPEQIFKPFFLLIFITCLYINNGEGKFQAFHAMMFNVLSAGIAFILGAWILMRCQPLNFSKYEKKYELSAWKKSLVPFSMLSGFSIISTQTDILMLGLLGGASDVGLYKIAIQWADTVALGIMAANIITMPEIAKFSGLADRDKLSKIAHKNAIFSSGIAIFFTIILFFFGEWIISISFGDEYLLAYYPLIFLSIGQLINASFGQGGVILNMCGKENSTLITLVLTGILNVLLNYLLIPHWGINGAAAATLISIFFRKLIIWFMLYSEYKIDSSVLGIKFKNT